MARRKMWTLMGHSNGEGFAGADQMMQSAPWLQDFATNYGVTRNGPNATPAITASTYQNIYAWTSKLGFTAPNSRPPQWSPADGQFLPLTMRYANSPADIHPYPSPYNYPNGRSMPGSPSVYDASRSNTGSGTWAGIELPLSWRLSHYWLENVYFNKLSIPSTYFLRSEPGFTAPSGEVFGVPFGPFSPSTGPYYQGYNQAYYAWYTPADRFDWDPASDRLYGSWKSRMQGAAKEAAASGDLLDVRFAVFWLGDNDANIASVPTSYVTSPGNSRVKDWEVYYRAFIDKVRSDLVDNNWTSLPKEKIPIVGMKIFRTYGAASIRTYMNEALDRIQEEDPYFTTLATDSYQTLYEAGYTVDGIQYVGLTSHFSHNGYLKAADDIFNAYIAMENGQDDALANENRVSVEDVKNRVLTYYERNRTSTNATTEALIQHINGAMFHILNKVSDSAWWLRVIEPISITGGPTTPVVLPKRINRILKIERTGDPGYPLKFDMLGFTESGCMQILMKESYVGTYNVHYITVPRDLTRESELVPLPYNLIEWLVVEAAKRLARSSGNVTMLQALTAEAEELKNDCMRNIAAVRRPANDRLYGQRRLPSRRSYGRRWWGY